MKLAILTSDIIDGRIVAEELLRSGRSVSAIVYEKSGNKADMLGRLKASATELLLRATGKLRYGSFENMARDFRGVKVRPTENINYPDNAAFLSSIRPDLLVVVGTRKLKKEIFSLAPGGAINLHSGILPFYRGSDSEFWALYNSEPDKVGVTIHFIDDGLDTGDIIVQERQRIHPRDTIGSLRIGNIFLGAKKINDAISMIESGHNTFSSQRGSFFKTYRSAQPKEKRSLKKRLSDWRRRGSAIKIFDHDTMVVREEVARTPLVNHIKGMTIDYPNIFCMRIDADEYHAETISSFNSLFSKYYEAVTIFVNASNFYNQRDLIKKWHNEGMDIQSHGFYHHTYADYASNRYNIHKARIFFEGLGIKTNGFVSPTGRWNPSLSQALEDEGYGYSSEFSYDYMGLPSYPSLGNQISNVLEIPVFPVAPELFLNTGINDIDRIVAYYTKGIDEMKACGLPVIIYAHTSRYNEVPVILSKIAGYALSDKGLTPANMSSFYEWWKNKPAGIQYPHQEKCVIRVPREQYLGKKTDSGYVVSLKNFIKRALDFERVTPDEELRCSHARKMLKMWARKFI